MPESDVIESLLRRDPQIQRRLAALEAQEVLKTGQHAFAHACSMFLALPGLRGFWPMSAVAYTNPQGLDISANGHHLTNNNDAVDFGYDGLAPYAAFDGLTAYLTKADGGAANWADIIGDEAFIVSGQRGLTIGGWFQIDDLAPGANEGFIGKYNNNAVNERSYQIDFEDGANTARFVISTDGIASVIATGAVLAASTWYFLVGRFDPSTEVAIFVNNAKVANAAGIPATLFDSTANFLIGGFANGLAATLLEGKASMCFLCAAMVSDVIISTLYQQSRPLVGV